MIKNSILPERLFHFNSKGNISVESIDDSDFICIAKEVRFALTQYKKYKCTLHNKLKNRT